MLLNILTIIYDIDQSIVYSIQNYLNYLFIFVGKIDSVTQFLIHILRNNHSLLLKLLSDTESKDDNFQTKESLRNLFESQTVQFYYKYL